jgi:hypothetical protein
LEEFQHTISEQFEMKDLGNLNWCLGIKVKYNREAQTLWMGQTQYTMEILKDHSMADCIPAFIPADPNVLFSKDQGPTSASNIKEML